MLATPIHHAAIVVSNLEKSLQFYRDLLGMKVLFNETLAVPNLAEVMGFPSGLEGRTVILQKDKGVVDGMVEIMEITRPKPQPSERKGAGFRVMGLRMLSFRVDDIENAYNVLTSKGIRFLSPPRLLTMGAFSIKACVFKDPDDVLIEIIQFMPQPGKKG